MEDVLSEAKNSFKGDVDEPVTMMVTNIDNDDIGLTKILDPTGMSSLRKLVIITALVPRFIGNLRKKTARQDINNDEMDADEYQDALTRWIKEEQRLMQRQTNFGKLRNHFISSTMTITYFDCEDVSALQLSLHKKKSFPFCFAMTPVTLANL